MLQINMEELKRDNNVLYEAILKEHNSGSWFITEQKEPEDKTPGELFNEAVWAIMTSEEALDTMADLLRDRL